LKENNFPYPSATLPSVLDFRPWSTALVGLRPLYDVPRSHSDTPHSVEFFWTGDRPVSDTCNRQLTTIIRYRRDSKKQFQQMSDRRPTP